MSIKVEKQAAAGRDGLTLAELKAFIADAEKFDMPDSAHCSGRFTPSGKIRSITVSADGDR